MGSYNYNEKTESEICVLSESQKGYKKRLGCTDFPHFRITCLMEIW